MKNIILKITNYNWDEIGPGDWVSTEWSIWDDLTVEIKEERNLYSAGVNEDGSTTVLKCCISKRKLEKIFEQINTAKSVDLKIDADDGDAWEFIQYQDGNIIWKRDNGYIYDIAPLEKIAKMLYWIKFINKKHLKK